MKLHPSLNRTMIATIAASVFLSGALAAASARDRDGVRRMEPRTRQQQNEKRGKPSRNQKNTVNRRSNKRTTVAKHRRSTTRAVAVLPRGYRSFKSGGHQYYHHNGVYYTRYQNGYRMVSAPRITRLPRFARRVRVNRTVYYVYDNVYYLPCNGYYEVCAAPYYSNSIEFNAGPVRIVLTDHDHCHY